MNTHVNFVSINYQALWDGFRELQEPMNMKLDCRIELLVGLIVVIVVGCVVVEGAVGICVVLLTTQSLS